TLNGTTAAPWPPGVPVIDTQFASAETDQVQSRVVEIAMEPLPPLGGNGLVGALVTLIWHLSEDGDTTEVDVDVLLQRAVEKAEATPTEIGRASCRERV